MVQKSDRHAMIETICQWEKCGKTFLARRERVEKGQSRFCSWEHYREYQKTLGPKRKRYGKENAVVSWDKRSGIYRAYWYDESLVYRSSPWGRWAWELNFGEIPEGYRVGYKDGNPKNNIVENIVLVSSEEYGKRLSKLSKGRVFSEEHKQAISKGRTGMTLSNEHRKHIAESNSRKWAEGIYDKVHKGKYNKHWRGGVEKGYTYDFENLRVFVRDRDNYLCQICGKHLHKNRDGHVHHIDGNKKHNEMDNLILLCTSCHGKVHAKNPAPPTILAFRAMLEWNHNDMPEHNLPNPLNFPEEQ